MKLSSQDKPDRFPIQQVDGSPLKPLTQVLLDRRATAHFKKEPVPDEYLEAILRFAGQAPSGYNLQPWHFIVVRNEKNRRRLQKAAANQLKVAEAPVVIIAFGIPGEWKQTMASIFEEGVRRGSGKEEEIENTKKRVTDFLNDMPPATWLNRHVMIALTTMMLMAETYGLDTAPMEGFDPEAVRAAFNLPAEAVVVALLAIGFAQEPEKAYPGRLPLTAFVHEEGYKLPAS